MRKIKKINGFLVVKFNDREKREYEGTALGEYGVIDAEVYTGNLDIDRGAMEYDDADTLEVAVELARGLESEEDITDEPPTYTAAVETNESYTEEAVEPTALIEGWTRRLATQVKSKHYPDTDPRTAAHELYGFKMALHQIGFLPESEVITDPDTFGAGRLDGPMPRNPEELLAFVCDERCKNRAGHTQEELDAICAKCPLGQLYEDAEAQDLRIRERSERALQEHIEGVRRAEDTVTALLGGHEALAYLAALRDGQILQENECEHYAAQIAEAGAAWETVLEGVSFEDLSRLRHLLREVDEYTAKAMTGQNRKHRKIDLDFAFDSETVGFYQSIGIQEVGRSLPYQPWDKPIERFFSTVCSKFSKWFESYTGTLTGSKTYAKRQKDIDQMLERGELLTMEEFFEVWTEWKNTKYHTRKHRGLSDAGEKWVTPIEMFENGPRYEKAAPPREYAAMLLMKAATARVTNQGINKFGTLYTDTELAYYVNQKVNIKWDIDDVTKLYVYDMDGKKICEAVSAELLAFGPHCSQAALEKHLRDQKRNEREVREYLEERVRPYELRLEDGARPSDAVGMIDLTIKATPSQKLVSLPKDRMFRSEQASKASRKKVTDDTFLNAKGDKALSLLRAMNE